MESDPFQFFQQQQSQQQPNSGLMRYRSVPSSYFANLLEKDIFDELLMNRPASPDMFARLISGSGDLYRNSQAEELGHRQPELHAPAKPKVEGFQQTPKQEQEVINYTSQNYYQTSLPNQDMNYQPVNPLVGVGSNTGGLIRQSSSPAGFLDKHVEGFGVMRNLAGSGGEPSFAPSDRFRNQMPYLPRQPSGQMSPIAEIGSKGVGKRSPEGGGDYDPDFQLDHWDDSPSMSGSFGDLGRGNDMEVKEDEEGRRILTNPPLLAHHLSLPNPRTSAEMSSFLQFQDSVPCKVRAKRGFATHPRSIAERVRRTKISERIRKLQDLVPNMDKQTNTSDMLDLAVDYIKELQDEVKSLSDNRTKCVCSNKQML